MPSSPFLFSKHSNICFAISFCILAFPLEGFIRNMNILLSDILLIFILYYFSGGVGSGRPDPEIRGGGAVSKQIFF